MTTEGRGLRPVGRRRCSVDDVRRARSYYVHSCHQPTDAVLEIGRSKIRLIIADVAGCDVIMSRDVGDDVCLG